MKNNYTIYVDGIVRQHRLQDGCVLVLKRTEGMGEPELLRIYECLQHLRETCKCGIEFTYHCAIYDNIKKYNEQNNLVAIQNGESIIKEIGREVARDGAGGSTSTP